MPSAQIRVDRHVSAVDVALLMPAWLRDVTLNSFRSSTSSELAWAMTPFLSRQPDSDSNVFAGTQSPQPLPSPESDSKFSPSEVIRIVLPRIADQEGNQNESRIVVGRVSSTDVAVADPLLSRQHFECVVCDGKWHARDLNSKNGTLLNDTPLAFDPIGLNHGDKIRAGGSVFVLQIE